MGKYILFRGDYIQALAYQVGRTKAGPVAELLYDTLGKDGRDYSAVNYPTDEEISDALAVLRMTEEA